MQSCYQNICPRSGRYASAPHAKDGFQDPPQGFWRFHHNDLHSIASLSLQIRLSQSLPCSPTQAPAPNAASQTGWSSRVAPAAQTAAPYSRFLPCDVIKAAPLLVLTQYTQGTAFVFSAYSFWLRISSARPLPMVISSTGFLGSLLMESVSPRLSSARSRGYFVPFRVTPDILWSSGTSER